MSSLNKVMIIGNLGRNPDVKNTCGGMKIANISVATSEKFNDKNTGDKIEKTEWHKCIAFGKLAEIIEKYLKQGSKVYIEGKIQTRKWEDEKSGTTKYSTEIIINELKMLSSNNKSIELSEDINEIPF